MNARAGIMTGNKNQSMNGTGHSMHTAQQNRRPSGIAQLLRTAILGLTLTLGLSLGYGQVQAEEGDRNTRQVQRSDNDRQDKHENAPEKEHPDNPPAITLSAPAAGSAKLYPAAFNLEAAVAFPGKAGTRNDRREGVEIEFLADGRKFAEAKRAPYSASYTPPKAGIYTLSARIRYGEGKRTIQSNSVEIVSDLPPTVNLTTPANNTVLTAPANFTLNADAAAPIGSIAKVEFYNGTTLIGTATSAPYSITWNNVPAGSYTLVARATDNYGFSSSTSAVSVVSNAPPTISLANPADNTVVAAPGSFTLSANAADSDGSIAKIEYYNGTALIGTATAAPYSYTWSNVAAGIYTITARATDNHGASTASTQISVISDTPPSVGITAPAEGAVSTAPGSFTLTADAASSMSTIARVEFYNGATLIGTATGAPYTYTWSNVPAGSYTITAKATDGYGITNTSAAINVVSNATPTVSLTGPAANAVSVAPGNFTLTAEATDSDGTIAKVEFYAGNGTTNTGILIGTATAAPYSVDWSNVPAGSYSLTAKATDNHGAATTSAAVAVTSNQAPTVTLTGPADGTQITSPNSFILTAEAADADGSIAKVEFYNGTTLLGTATSAPYTYIWANVPVGNYSLTAIATDNHGGQTNSPAISVTAIANVPPTVALTGPVNGATATVPGSFTLTATAGSTTSTIAKVDFYAIDNATNASTLIGTATSVPYTANWSNVPIGSYTLSAVATDTLGASTTSSQVSVTVNTGVAQAYYIHTDHLNSPRTITDTAGNIVWQWDNSDPFGNNVPDQNPSGLGTFEYNQRFAGQYFDRETGLHYNFYRDGYNPEIGAYTQSDPIGLEGGINTYTYVNGNPLRWVDPSGLLTFTVGGTVRIPGWVSWLIPGYIGQGASAGVAIQVTNECGQFSPDLGAYSSVQGGGQDIGIGRGAANFGIQAGSIQSLAGTGADLSGHWGLYGGTVNLDAHGNPTGASFDFGFGYNVGGSGSVTSTWSIFGGATSANSR